MRVIKQTRVFEKKFNKLSKSIQDAFRKQIELLMNESIDPCTVGDALGIKYLKERVL